jgi:aspartyl-tRNA(Asn)/glutamyl-tRNA(Gln) amidotransferase subunit C
MACIEPTKYGNFTRFSTTGIKRMSLDRSDVEKIAHLARMALEEEQIASYAADLSNILGLVEQLEAVDTTDVTPMAHPLHMVQRLRADEVTEENHRDDYQAIAPKVDNGLFLVPKVIE